MVRGTAVLYQPTAIHLTRSQPWQHLVLLALLRLISGNSLLSAAHHFGTRSQVRATSHQKCDSADGTQIVLLTALLVAAACLAEVARHTPTNRRSRTLSRSQASRQMKMFNLRTLVCLSALLVCATLRVIPSTRKGSKTKILSSVKSVTGWVVVGEESINEASFRYLRASFSVLGGLWLADKHLSSSEGGGSTEQDNLQKASIFSNFVLQQIFELARPVQAHPHEERVLAMSVLVAERKVLLISLTNGINRGLGVGVVARASHRQGFNVTAVELDPAIIEAARRYFGCPDLRGGYICQDVRAFLRNSEPQVRFPV